MINTQTLHPQYVIGLKAETQLYREFRFCHFGNDDRRARDSALIFFRSRNDNRLHDLVEYDRPTRDNAGWVVCGYPTDEYETAYRYAMRGIFWNAEAHQPNITHTVMEQWRLARNSVKELEHLRNIPIDDWYQEFPEETKLLRDNLQDIIRYADLGINWDIVNNVPDINRAMFDYALPRSSIPNYYLKEKIMRLDSWVEHFPDCDDLKILISDHHLIALWWELGGDVYYNTVSA